jgi:hypothetical protein
VTSNRVGTTTHITVADHRGDDGAKAPAAQAPLVEVVELRAPPAHGDETEHGDEREQQREDDERGRVRVVRLGDDRAEHRGHRCLVAR